MNRKPFKFKQFDIYQDQTAMKVGTDGVILGAWSNLESGNKILDIGTGTGLISLMLAQRFPEAIVDAVELDDDAFIQAQENFTNSKFSDRLQVQKTAIQDFISDYKYDLIVSNPPFFVINERVELDARKKARQQETLTFDDLLSKTAQLLTENGVASFVIPYDLEANFLQIAKELNLFPSKIVRVKGNKQAEAKRSLINLKFNSQETIFSELIVEIARHQYTEDYINLTKEFYLKM